MRITIFLIAILLLALATITGERSTKQKNVVKSLIYARIFYIILIADSLLNQLFSFHRHPYLVIADIVILVGLITSIELMFSHRQASTVTTTHKLILTGLFILAILANCIILFS